MKKKRAEKHNFAKILQHFVKIICHNLTREMAHKINFAAHVNEFISDFGNFIASEYFEGVNDLDFLSEVLRDVVMQQLEMPLYEHYCSRYAAIDAKLSQKMSCFLTMTPPHFKIPPKYWLMDSFAVEPAYQSASQRLKTIERTASFKKKFEILVSVNEEITKCVRNYYKNYKGKESVPEAM